MNIKKKKITERLYLWILQARKIKSKKKKKNKSHDKLSNLYRIYRFLSLKYYTVFKYYNLVLVYSCTSPNRAQMILILLHDDSFLNVLFVCLFKNIFFREYYRFQINERT